MAFVARGSSMNLPWPGESLGGLSGPRRVEGRGLRLPARQAAPSLQTVWLLEGDFQGQGQRLV